MGLELVVFATVFTLMGLELVVFATVFTLIVLLTGGPGNTL